MGRRKRLRTRRYPGIPRIPKASNIPPSMVTIQTPTSTRIAQEEKLKEQRSPNLNPSAGALY